MVVFIVPNLVAGTVEFTNEFWSCIYLNIARVKYCFDDLKLEHEGGKEMSLERWAGASLNFAKLKVNESLKQKRLRFAQWQRGQSPCSRQHTVERLERGPTAP